MKEKSNYRIILPTLLSNHSDYHSEQMHFLLKANCPLNYVLQLMAKYLLILELLFSKNKIPFSDKNSKNKSNEI
jgi:hypothetical protein